MQEELDSTIAYFQSQFHIKKHANFIFYEGSYLNHTINIILSGIGKVNAAIHTQFMIDHTSPELVINVGVAGGLSNTVTFGDVVIATSLIQHDVDVSAFGLPIGQIPRMDVFDFPCAIDLLSDIDTTKINDFKIHYGKILSGDQFIDDETKAIQLEDHFKALGVEMEGAAIAQVCHVNNIQVMVIRSISDMAGIKSKATHSFDELKYMASGRAGYMLYLILNLLQR